MTTNNCHEILRELDLYWHDILGLEGNYYLGSTEARLALSLITYKRVCDCIREYMRSKDMPEHSSVPNSVPWDYSSFEYRTASHWEYVMEQANKIKALSEAIDCINTLNYRNIAFGDNIIPELPYRTTDEVILNRVLEKWMCILSSFSLDNKAISNEDWLQFSRLIRSRIANN